MTTTVKDNEGREFTVKVNSYSSENAVWIMGIDSDDPFDSSGTFTLDAARQIRDDLSAVIADIEEAIKPKPATAAELNRTAMGTKAYALGLSPADKGTIWMQVRGGSWAVIEDGGRTHRIGDLYDSAVLDRLVVLNPEEVN